MSHPREAMPPHSRPGEGNNQHHRWTIGYSRPTTGFTASHAAAEEASSMTSSRSRTSRFTEEVDEISPPSTPPHSARNFPLVHQYQTSQHQHQHQQAQRRRLQRRPGRLHLRESISSDRIATTGGTPRSPSVFDESVEGEAAQPGQSEEPTKRTSLFSSMFSKKAKRTSLLERSLTVLRAGSRRHRGNRGLETADTPPNSPKRKKDSIETEASRVDFPFSPVDWTDPVQRRASYTTRTAAPPVVPARDPPEREIHHEDHDEVRVEPPSMSRFSISTDGGDIEPGRGLMRRILSKPWRSLRARRDRDREAEQEQQRSVSSRRRPPPIQIIRRPLQVVREEQRTRSDEPSSAGERLSWVEGDDGAATSATEQISFDRPFDRRESGVYSEESEGKDSPRHRQHNDSGIFITPEGYRRSLPADISSEWRRPTGMRPPSVRPITEAWWLREEKRDKEGPWI